MVDYSDPSAERRVRERYVTDYLASSRMERYLATQIQMWASLAQYTGGDKIGEKLSTLDARYWDQAFPWDFHKRVYEAELTDKQLAELNKVRVLSGGAALVALFEEMSAAGEI